MGNHVGQKNEVQIKNQAGKKKEALDLQYVEKRLVHNQVVNLTLFHEQHEKRAAQDVEKKYEGEKDWIDL